MPAHTGENLGRTVFRHSVRNDQVGTLTGEGDGNPFSDPGSSAGDDRNSTLQPAHPRFSLAPGARPRQIR